ncbi:hypothetical protein [Streptomyces sp. B3I8]|uniref:hypothetical protein n=1 Tax=Streptomyces sp. B3I8 TaxID=3042303 RepID=UPI00277DC3E2|nr:hypothetical protein [Streptomyces sp. B3I8]MDQ0787052.1 hypothetical protein [Streptomyces sp. B3I8]
MWPTSRATLAATGTRMAATVCATPVAVARTVPVPLATVEKSCAGDAPRLETPRLIGDPVVPVPDTPEGTRPAERHLPPERARP